MDNDIRKVLDMLNSTFLKKIALEIVNKYYNEFMLIDLNNIDEIFNDLDSIDNRILSDIFSYDIEIEDGVVYFMKEIVRKLHVLN